MAQALNILLLVVAVLILFTLMQDDDKGDHDHHHIRLPFFRRRFRFPRFFHRRPLLVAPRRHHRHGRHGHRHF